MNKKSVFIKVLLLFISMILTIALTIVFCVVDFVSTAGKVFIFVVGILLSIVEFAYIQRFNQVTSSNNDNHVEEKVPLVQTNNNGKTFSTTHILCPKCGKPYDGFNCFYCGFVKEEK